MGAPRVPRSVVVAATAIAVTLSTLPRSAAGAPPAESLDPWSLPEIEARALPTPAEAEARSLLAEARSELAGTRSRLREGPTVAFAAGPRRAGGGESADRADLAAEIDLPLTPAGPTREALRRAIDGAERELPAGPRAEARLRRAELYLDVWLAQRSAAIREADLATVERWLGAARARLDAGADPPFELTLVEGERLRAQLDLAAAKREAALAWGELSTLATGLPATPPPLADPGEADGSPPGGDTLDASNLATSPRVRSAEARLALAEARAALAETLELSPWSLRGSVAREGLDTFGRFGVAYKLPLRGEPEAVRLRFATEREAARRSRDLEIRSLTARLAVARAGLSGLPPAPADLDLERALAAVELRLTEGKERPSEALPLRRQLLETRISALRREHLRFRLAAEIRALTGSNEPSEPNANQDGQP